MIQEFTVEEKDPAPAAARYLVHSWNGVEWFVGWRANPEVPWLVLASADSADAALARMRKHVEAQSAKPWYYNEDGAPVG